MINIKKDFPLGEFNSFRVDCIAKFFCEVRNETDCIEAIDFADKKKLQIQILGEGTNILFSENYQGLVIRVNLKGIKSKGNLVSVACGESWHESVLWTLKNNLYGLENLSLIPGNVGAAPVQNIGAYGKEISSFIKSVKVLNLETKQIEEFSKLDCKFTYRSSIFKELKNLLILEITLDLLVTEDVDISYNSLKNYMMAEGLDLLKPTATQVCRCVCELRNKILPDPKKIPNVGSFFKNSVISKDDYSELTKIIDIPCHEDEQGMLKISSAFLIEKAGWKGFNNGNVSVSEKHSLVFLSNGKASGAEILSLAGKIKDDVFKKFGINLSIEPSII